MSERASERGREGVSESVRESVCVSKRVCRESGESGGGRTVRVAGDVGPGASREQLPHLAIRRLAAFRVEGLRFKVWR